MLPLPRCALPLLAEKNSEITNIPFSPLFLPSPSLSVAIIQNTALTSEEKQGNIFWSQIGVTVSKTLLGKQVGRLQQAGQSLLQDSHVGSLGLEVVGSYWLLN